MAIALRSQAVEQLQFRDFPAYTGVFEHVDVERNGSGRYPRRDLHDQPQYGLGRIGEGVEPQLSLDNDIESEFFRQPAGREIAHGYLGCKRRCKSRPR